ncbi:MAG: pseudouridine synthase [Aphanocapsa sp. GSE-SYN-MK-11-07L]|nr:pseudouridine synthase [Aphanocapsa sp. GSE-SYN-MK-11-07L]
MSYQYLIFYKPYGVLSQFSDSRPDGKADRATSRLGQQTLREYVSIPEVYPVGRLDRDSEGLLLLTDHGQLQHRLSDPKFGHTRTYWVQVEGLPTASALTALQQGVEIQDYQTRPAQVQPLLTAPNIPDRQPPIRFRKSIPTSWLEMTLTEGRNRQVRRMTAAVGFPTLRLIRVAIANLALTGLAVGEWRFLTDQERQHLLKLTKLDRPWIN